jgi:ribA/ribD-fused uncharacterized protein
MVPIYFHKSHPDYGWLSNMHPCTFTLAASDPAGPDGGPRPAEVGPAAGTYTYTSSEQCFQHRKLLLVGNDKQAAKVLGAEKPTQCKARAGKRCAPMTDEQIETWEAHRVAVMREAVAAKFAQNEDLRQRLLATGDAQLVEKLPRFADAFWGVNGKGEGENQLGRILMDVRGASV